MIQVRVSTLGCRIAKMPKEGTDVHVSGSTSKQQAKRGHFNAEELKANLIRGTQWVRWLSYEGAGSVAGIRIPSSFYRAPRTLSLMTTRISPDFSINHSSLSQYVNEPGSLRKRLTMLCESDKRSPYKPKGLPTSPKPATAYCTISINSGVTDHRPNSYSQRSQVTTAFLGYF